MSQPLAVLLSRIAWQYYVTLSFGGNWNGKRSRNKIDRLFAWLRKEAVFHRHSSRLCDWRWVIAEEFGEIGERYHLHLLLADLKAPNITHCKAMVHCWKEAFRGGWAIIRPYDPSLGGVGYVVKTVQAADLRLSAESEDLEQKLELLTGSSYGNIRSIEEANRYEVTKMGREEGALCEPTVTLSLETQRCLRSLVGGSGDRRNYRRGITDRFRPWKSRDTRRAQSESLGTL